MATIRQFVVKDATEIRDDILRTIRNGLVTFGVANPNVGPNSDWILGATALGDELAVIGANNVVAVDNIMPDTAGDEGIARWCEVLGIVPQPATGSIGYIVLSSSAPCPVATGQELTDSAGLRYRVVTGGTYANGSDILVEAVSVGAETNHDEGDVLRWAGAPPFAEDRALVGAGGLVNGAPAQDLETLRAIVLDRLQTPSGSGNWAYGVACAERSSPKVQKAFFYPAVQGPATGDLAVVAAPTDTEKTRNVAATVVSFVVDPFVRGLNPEHPNLTITTVDNVETDVAIAIQIPDAPTANPPGAGGGWVNGTPWPRPDGVSTFRCTVTGVTSSTVITVDAAQEPTIGVSRIAWLSPLNWQVYTALVVAVSGTPGAYTITLDAPFPNVMVGAYVWPECENAKEYCAAVLAAYKGMGPGEKTTNASALNRGFRHPPPSVSWPMAIGPNILNALTADALPEVSAAQYLHRTDGTTTLAGSAGTIVPQVPTLLSGKPKQFIPRHIGLYRQP